MFSRMIGKNKIIDNEEERKDEWRGEEKREGRR